MKAAQGFTRGLFFSLAVLVALAYTTLGLLGEISAMGIGMGLVLGFACGTMLLALDALARQSSLQFLNTVTLGLFFGTLFGHGVWTVASAALMLAPKLAIGVKAAIYLTSAFLGVMITLRASEGFYICLPFVRLQAAEQPKRDILLDGSILADPRLIDLASSGLLDQLLILPRFLINYFTEIVEKGDEAQQGRARRSLETVKRLEALPHLKLRFNDSDMASEDSSSQAVVKLARLLGADVLTADVTRVKAAAVEGVRFINIHSLSNSLKPIMQSGEQMELKIQRRGKEERQGVGYLEDGTMVVVNGGGDYIGETIQVHVLSVKHTSSGRMIFCNAAEAGLSGEHEHPIPQVARISVRDAAHKAEV